MTRKLAISILAAFVLVPTIGLFSSCKNDDEKTVWDEYKTWRNDNNQWLEEQQQLKDAQGNSFYTTYVPNWDKTSFVLIHYFNDRALTQGNLSPLSTSTVDVRYHLSLFDGTPVDSSTNIDTYGKGIFRTRLDQVIPGWTAALSQMRVGDTCQVIVPYYFGYGSSVSTLVPPYSNLKFNIRLVDIPYYETSPYN